MSAMKKVEYDTELEIDRLREGSLNGNKDSKVVRASVMARTVSAKTLG